MKVTVHVFFTIKLRLCERAFVDLPSVSKTGFVELARGVMVQLLNFVELLKLVIGLLKGSKKFWIYTKLCGIFFLK